MTISVTREKDLYFPKGNENGDYYEALYVAKDENGKSAHGRTPEEAIRNLEKTA